VEPSFCPNAETGEVLATSTTLLSRPSLGKARWPPETLNCNAPDTGKHKCWNSHRHARAKKNSAQSPCWQVNPVSLAMTEPDHGRRQMPRTSLPLAVLGKRRVVINGEEILYLRCCGAIRAVDHDHYGQDATLDADPFRQQSQILVPIDTPGV